MVALPILGIYLPFLKSFFNRDNSQKNEIGTNCWSLDKCMMPWILMPYIWNLDWGWNWIENHLYLGFGNPHDNLNPLPPGDPGVLETLKSPPQISFKFYFPIIDFKAEELKLDCITVYFSKQQFPYFIMTRQSLVVCVHNRQKTIQNPTKIQWVRGPNPPPPGDSKVNSPSPWGTGWGPNPICLILELDRGLK